MQNFRNIRNIPWLKWSSSFKLSLLWRPETQVGASSGKLHESKQSVMSSNIPSPCTNQYKILLLKLLMENTEDAFPQIVSECFAGSGGIPACCSACGGIPTKPLYRNSYSVSRVVRSFSAQDLHTHFVFWADGCSFPDAMYIQMSDIWILDRPWVILDWFLPVISIFKISYTVNCF